MFQRPAGVSFALTVLAATAIAAAAEGQGTTCTVTRAGETAAGPCRFTLGPGGSFVVGLEGVSVSVDVTGTGTAEVSAEEGGSAPVAWGGARRDASDGACWAGEDFRVCARAADAGAEAAVPAIADPPTDAPVADPPAAETAAEAATADTPPADIQPGDTPAADTPASVTAATDPATRPVRFVGRCHMDACSWIEQGAPRQLGEGSAAVPGRRIETPERWATREYPGGDYPDAVPEDLDWDEARQVQYFCSPTRPAIREPDGAWSVLPLPEVFGATEAATLAYARACHPDLAGDDPYELAEAMGDKAEPADGPATYPDVAALVAP